MKKGSEKLKPHSILLAVIQQVNKVLRETPQHVNNLCRTRSYAISDTSPFGYYGKKQRLSTTILNSPAGRGDGWRYYLHALQGVHLRDENRRNIPPPPFPSETFSLSRDFQHLISEASLKYRKVALLIISVMIVNKLQYFVDPFPFALQTKGQSH